MKRYHVIAMVLASFIAGANVGKLIEKSTPIININVNGSKVDASTDQEITCKVRDFYRNQLPYNFEFKSTKNKLRSLERHDKIYGMEVSGVRNYSFETMLFLNVEDASGGMVIAHCEYE